MIAKLNYPQIGLFVLAWFAVDLLTPLLMRAASKIGAVDRPCSHKTHDGPIPFLGGVALYLAFSIALFSILRFTSFGENRELFSIVFAGIVVVIVGCIDDYRPVPALVKLVILLAATWGISRFGVHIRLVGVEWLDLVLTALWVAGVTSAMNSLDNTDGAATGVSAIAAFWVFYIAFKWEGFGQPGASYVAIALCGACVGLLRYNFPPARIFLGDNGALLLGFLLGALTVLTGWARADKVKAVVIPCAVLVVPLYDITLSTILRIRRGRVRGIVQAISYCGRDHVAHRLMALGLSRRETVLMLYLFGMLGGAAGMLISRADVGREVYLPVVGAGMAVLILLGFVLDRAKVYEDAPERKLDAM